jgi:hypothetical protein
VDGPDIEMKPFEPIAVVEWKNFLEKLACTF